MGSEKFNLSLSDFGKAAKGSLYTFLGTLGAFLLPLADTVKNGQQFEIRNALIVLFFSVSAAFISALGNLLIRFFTDTTK